MSYRAAEAGVPSADPGLFAFSHPSVCAAARCLPLQQLEVVLFEPDEPVTLHLRELGRQRAAVDAEVAGHLLAREGDGKAAAFVLERLLRQVGQHALANGLGRRVHDAARQRDVLQGGDAHKVLDDAVVIGAGLSAHVQHFLGVEQQDATRFRCDGIDEQLRRADGVRLAEHLPRLRMHEDVARTPDMIRDDVDAAVQHDAEAVRDVSSVHDRFALVVGALMGIEAGEHALYVQRIDTLEQHGMCGSDVLHAEFHFVVATTYLS